MTTQPALTSVVMITYHTGPVLDQSISAVLAQTAPVELILVNNGNPPQIEEKLVALAKNEPRVRFVTGQGNVGFSTGCNLGAKNAQGDYILFLNPDSILPPQAVARAHEYGVKLARPYMLGARLLDGEGKDQRGCRRALLTPMTALIEAFHLYRFFPKQRLNLHEEPLPKTIVPVEAISGAFMFLPVADLWEINGFDEGYFLHVEDLDLCLRFSRAGGTIYFVPDIVVTHIGGTSKTTSEFLERHKAAGFRRYFHENFNHDYPQPVLWLLDAAIMMRLWVKLRLVKRGVKAV